MAILALRTWHQDPGWVGLVQAKGIARGKPETPRFWPSSLYGTHRLGAAFVSRMSV